MSNQEQQQTQPKKRGSSIIMILIVGVLLFLVISSMGSCGGSKADRMEYSKFTRDIGLISTPIGTNDWNFEHAHTKFTDEAVKFEIPANNIRAMVQQGNNFYVLYRDSVFKQGADPQIVTKFMSNPSKHADYYFYYSQTGGDGDPSAIWTAFNSYVKSVMQPLAVTYLKGAPLNIDIKSPTFDIETLDETQVGYVNFVNNYNTNYQVRLAPTAPAGASWFSFDNILTMVWIIVICVFMFIIFRSFMGNRGGLGNMGRNRATHTIGGAVKFHDVAGIEEEKEEVQEIVQFLKNPRKFLDLGARIPKGVLLVGAPGTGKTLLAKAIAGEAGVHFFSISGSDFSEMLVGVGPSRMRDLFETAKANAPAIIFIDEIDSIARMRGVGVSGVSDENEQTLNQLLVQMDGFTKSEGVIVIAATNRPDVLDQALLRPGRFDRQIVVQLPDVKGREQILKVHAKGKPIGEDVDLKRVAQIISGFSGADIENLLNEAAIIAAKKDKRRINMADITEGINKVLLGPQKRSRIITDEDKKITAYHEAGHAVVSRMLQPDQVVQEVSIIPRGMAAGYTLTNEKDVETHHKSKKFLTTHLAMLMAGRVAEQIFMGDTCTGSSNDLKVATDLAERMVTMFGMSSKLGPLYYAKEEEMALRLYNAQNPRSEALQSVIDDEVKALIIAAEKSAHDILTKQKAKVETMTEILLARETIYAADIALIMDGKAAKSIIAEMEKRDEAAKAQEEKDRLDSELVVLNQKLDEIMRHSKRFVDAKLAAPEKLVILEQNFELARDCVRKGRNLPMVAPTLDNLDTYAQLINDANPVAETPKADEPVKKTKSTKKTTEAPNAQA